jgi:hypothetical protein
VRKHFIASMVLMLSAAPHVNAQEREWSLDRTDQDVFLVFGTPQTDDVGASFWCRIGTPRIRIFLPLALNGKHPQPPSKLKLNVADKTFTLPVNLNNDDSRDNATLEAEFDATGPIVDQLTSANYFAVTIDSEKRSFPLVNADFGGLLRLCASPPPDALQEP